MLDDWQRDHVVLQMTYNENIVCIREVTMRPSVYQTTDIETMLCIR